MFLAGECASIVLHRDMGKAEASSGGLRFFTTQEAPEERFSGWPVLADVEGSGEDEALNARISGRFLVARLIRGLVEDDLVVDPDGLGHQLSGVRREVEAFDGTDEEARVWERILTALDILDHPELMTALLEWGGMVEGMGHLQGAREIHTLAYELAVAGGMAEAATDAARFCGRTLRKLAQWEEAVRWYGVARGVAEEVGNRRMLASVLDGLANTQRDRGNLPRAREILGQVLALGREENDLHVLAIAHHDLMTVEKKAGELDDAIGHGWEAVRSYDTEEGSLKALFDLAGVLKEVGELSAAWDAYAVVSTQVKSRDYRLLSLDGMAHIAALNGEEDRYEALRRQVDEMGWEGSSAVVRAQVLLYRGYSLTALKKVDEARGWLTRAVAFAEAQGLNQLIFEAEGALREIAELQDSDRSWTRSPAFELGSGVQEVRMGLRRMRESLAGAGGAL